jgi:hypothetical protein
LVKVIAGGEGGSGRRRESSINEISKSELLEPQAGNLRASALSEPPKSVT